MKKIILYPSDSLHKKQPEPMFADEYALAKSMGFDVRVFDHDLFVREGRIKGPNFVPRENAGLIYRGWMMNDVQYDLLFKTLREDFCIRMVSSPWLYKSCHYFPWSYKFIEEHTPKTVWVDTIDMSVMVSTFKELGSDAIIKDYVKSEKTENGIMRIDKDISPDDLIDVVCDFIKERGRHFNKGIVFKEFVELNKYFGLTNEYRCFCTETKFGRKTIISRNSLICGDIPSPPMEWVAMVVSNIQGAFFTVDVAEKMDGTWTVIEIGDGQVSGLAIEQDPAELYNNLMNLMDAHLSIYKFHET